MAVRTKPVRILESDHQPLRLIAELEHRKPSEVLHSALLEYIDNHRDVLASVFESTQRAIAEGDLDALTRIAQSSVEDRVTAAMARHDEL